MKFLLARWCRNGELLVRRLRHRILFRTTPHSIALGVAVGIFMGFLPLPVVGIPLAILLAWVLGANRVVVIPLLFVTNPLTVVPVYVLSYWLGCWVLGLPIQSIPWEILFERLPFWQRVMVFYRVGLSFYLPIFVGSTIIGGLLGVVSYGPVRWMLERRRRRIHRS